VSPSLSRELRGDVDQLAQLLDVNCGRPRFRVDDDLGGASCVGHFTHPRGDLHRAAINPVLAEVARSELANNAAETLASKPAERGEAPARVRESARWVAQLLQSGDQ
jgi:hypothetical protein